MINIKFNNTNYSIDETSLSSASAALKSHLSNVMSGSGATIEFGGTKYSIDSAKLSSATNAFVSHLGTISGNGHKIKVNGVEYNVDATKLGGAISELEVVLGNLNNGGGGDEPDPFVPELNEYGFMYNNLYTCAEADATVIFYEDGSALINMQGSETPVPAGYISYSEGVIDMSLLGYGTATVEQGGLVLKATDMGVDFYAVVTHGDYEYRYNYVYDRGWWPAEINGWGVGVLDNTKTSYGEILFFIADKPVTSLMNTFGGCESLTDVSNLVIPSSVTSMSHTFEGCTSLVKAPTIPSSVTDMVSTFSGCTSLTDVSDLVIPSSVTDISDTFRGCTSLTDVSDLVIPSSVTNMIYTFYGCTALEEAPAIPSSVTDMTSTFWGCTSLEKAPAIPSSVTDMDRTFCTCISLTGEVEINASNLTYYADCFYNTEKPITITGTTPFKAELAATANNGNVTFDVPAEERLEGDGQEFYLTAPSTLSFRSTAPLDEFQDIQINGEIVDPSNYTLEEGSTIVKLSHEYLQTLNSGKYELAVISNNKTAKGDFNVVVPELNEYGFYYNVPYYVEAEGFGASFTSVVVFYPNNTVGIYQIDSSNSYLEEWTYTDGIIAFNLDNDQVSGGSTGKTPFTGSFTNDGSTLSGVADFTDFGLLGSGPAEVTLEFMPERASLDEVYIYHPVDYETVTGMYYFPTNKTLAHYPAAKSNITGIPVIGVDYEAFMGFETVETVDITDSVMIIDYYSFHNSSIKCITIPANVTIIRGDAFSDCDNLNNIIFNGTMAQWDAIYKEEEWCCGTTPATYVQCSDGQVALN